MDDQIKKLEDILETLAGSHREDLRIEYSKRLLELDPTNFYGLQTLTRGYYRTQQLEEMFKTCQNGLAAHPDTWVFYNWLYYYYLAKGGTDYLKAKEAAEKALTFNPEGGFLHRNIAEIYLINWEPEKALSWLEKAIELEPDNPEYRSRYSIALIRCHKKDEALKVVQKSLKDDPDDKDVLDNAGMVYTLSGELDTAEKLFREALSRYPTYEYFQKHLSWVVSEKKDRESREAQGRKYTPLFLRHTGRKRFFDEDTK